MPSYICITCGTQFAETDSPPARCDICEDERQFVGWQDRRWVSFMYSYPNLIPLPPATITRIVAAIEPFPFDRIYGAWWGKVVAIDAKGAVQRSADRYIRALSSSLGG